MTAGKEDKRKEGIRLWRLDITKEFALFSIAFAILISILIYSPYQISQILNNIDDKLIDHENRSRKVGNIVLNDSLVYLKGIEDNNTKQIQTAMNEIITLINYYNADEDEDIDHIIEYLNLTVKDRIINNGTKFLIDNTTVFEIPLPIQDPNLLHSPSNGQHTHE